MAPAWLPDWVILVWYCGLTIVCTNWFHVLGIEVQERFSIDLSTESIQEMQIVKPKMLPEEVLLMGGSSTVNEVMGGTDELNEWFGTIILFLY